MNRLFIAITLSLIGCCIPVFAAESAKKAEPATGSPQPVSPLSLRQALKLGMDNHPFVRQHQSAVDMSAADIGRLKANYGFKVQLSGHLHEIEPSLLASDQSSNDSSASIRVRKELFDFGRKRNLVRAGDALRQQHRYRLLDARAKHQINLVRAFFNVIRADLTYAWRNEAMAVAYVQFDRMRDRRSVGRVSDVELLEFENRYESVRAKRVEAQNDQNHTREILAEVMGQHDWVPDKLVQPKFNFPKSPDALEELQQKALAGNAVLLAEKAQLEAAGARLKAGRAMRWPRVSTELQAWEYKRELSNRDQWRAGIDIVIPLWQGGAASAEIAYAGAEKDYWQNRLQISRDRIMRELREQWIAYQNVQAMRRHAKVQLSYRELYLDKKRALYELEVKTDLSDAMTQYTNARLEQLNADFELVLTWMQIQALTGQPIQLEKLMK